MLDPKVLQFLEQHDWVAEGIRALQPAGPMDRLGFRSQCGACGAAFSGSLRSFYLCDGRCSCGGMFDDGPLDALVLWAAAGRAADAQMPEGTFRIDPDGGDET